MTDFGYKPPAIPIARPRPNSATPSNVASRRRKEKDPFANFATTQQPHVPVTGTITTAINSDGGSRGQEEKDPFASFSVPQQDPFASLAMSQSSSKCSVFVSQPSPTLNQQHNGSNHLSTLIPTQSPALYHNDYSAPRSIEAPSQTSTHSPALNCNDYSSPRPIEASLHSQASQNQSTLSSPQTINGIFLGLDNHASPPPAAEENEEEEEDRVLVQAREAALYAEELLEQEIAEKAKRDPRKLFGLLPKAQELLQQKQRNQEEKSANETDKNRDWENDNLTIEVNPGETWEDTDGRTSEAPPWCSVKTGRNHTNSNSTGNDDNTQKKPGEGASVMGATVLGGVAGMVVLGPLAGVVAAGGAAYAAGTSKKGSVLRSAGGLVAQAGSAAKSFEDEHGLGKKTAAGVIKGVSWIAKTVKKFEE